MSVIEPKKNYTPVIRPVGAGLCVLMVCTDLSEAEKVGRQLLEVNNACLVTYRRAEDLIRNAPTGGVALAILATEDTPAVTSRILNWLRNRWPRCPIIVLGDGSGTTELTARQGGASYLTKPVTEGQWLDLLQHTVGKPDHQVKALREGHRR